MCTDMIHSGFREEALEGFRVILVAFRRKLKKQGTQKGHTKYVPASG